MTHRIPRNGERAAHRALDEDSGAGARTGVVQEVIGDDGPRLVVMQEADGQRVAYDERELVPLHTIPVLSRGPVILRPRHLWRLITGRRHAT